MILKILPESYLVISLLTLRIFLIMTSLNQFLLASFLKTLKRIKKICPTIYSNLKVTTSLFFSKIKKGITILGYPYNRSILVDLMEDSDVLSDFHSEEVPDLPEKYVLPVLIGMRRFTQAKSYLASKKEPEKFFAESFRFSVNSVLGEYRHESSQVLSKFAEFVKHSKLGPTIMRLIPPNYRVLLSLCLGKEK